MRHDEFFDSLRHYFPDVSKVDPRASSIMCRRDVSAEWIRGRYTNVDPAGFNPFFGKVFYSRYSCLDALASQSDASNADLFRYEVFYALHDFVHVWSLHELARMNQDALGSWDRIEDIDPVWFKLLLLFSEAAATVAVDYWMLGSRPLPMQLGSVNTFTTLTTPFNADRDTAQIDGNPHGVEIKSPAFLVQLALTYCVGWIGPLSDLLQSFGDHPPEWLAREHLQARRQIRLSDHWLNALQGGHGRDTLVEREHFEALIPQLLHIATELRDWLDGGYIKDPALCTPIVGWCDVPPSHIDFRFVNAPRWLDFGGTAADGENENDNRAYFNAQVVSRIRPCQLVGLRNGFRGKTLLEIPSTDLVAAIEELPRLSGKADGPFNLFFVS